MTLTTEEVGVLLPDVLEHYGKGKKCGVFFTGEQATSYVVERPGQIEMNLPKALLEQLLMARPRSRVTSTRTL